MSAKDSRALLAAVQYLVPVYGLGWLLGPIREVLVVPKLGRTAATAIEVPLLAVATYASARSAIRRLGSDPPPETRLKIGLLAFGMLGALELGGARFVRKLSVGSYLSTFRTPAGALSLAAFAWFALAPSLAGRVSRSH